MPKKKGDKGGNPNPVRSPEVVEQVFPRMDDDPYPGVAMTKKLQIWIYEPVAEALEKMPQNERVVWLRRVIAQAAIKELGVQISEASNEHNQ
jgi:hypothetical protein